MKDTIQIAATSDWHLGHPTSDTSFPTEQEIRASLQQALDDGVDAYLIAGDFIHQGQTAYAQYAASIIQPYVEKGLTVVGIVGNHDFSHGSADEVVSALCKSGVIMLEGQSYTLTNKTGDKQATIIGVSGEVGPDHDDWWRVNGWDMNGRRRAHEAAVIHRQALERELTNSPTETVVVMTHRGIVSDVIGSKAKQMGFVSAQTEGFAEIIDRHARQRHITVISGHDHDVYPWEGFPEGVTGAGVVDYNIASPLRRRMGEPLAKRITL